MRASGPASELIRSTIRAEGPVRFDRYVDLCLYAPDAGFFAGGAGAGRRGGDFVTSPEVGPLFGTVLGRFLDRWWDRLGRPDRFTVVDAGAGRGTLARAIMASPLRCAPALDLVLVERSAALRAEHPDAVTSLDELPDAIGPGVVMANELLDNLAPRVVERTIGGWAELHVGLDADGGLVETLLPCDEPPGLELPAGARVPLQAEAAAWVADAVALLRSGLVVAVDYASTTVELADRPWTDWLRTYLGHQRGGHPLDRPGGQDLTCDVCVDQLPPPHRVDSQAVFLREHGIDELVAEGRRIWSERAHLGDLEAVAARSRVGEGEALTDPGGLGAFAVMQWVVGDDDSPTITP